MKKINIVLVILSIFALQSCLLDDSTPTDGYGDGANFIGFESSNKSVNVPVPVDAVPVDFGIAFDLGGPTSNDYTGDIHVTVSVDESSSTAIDGVNYSLPSQTLTLTKQEDYSETLTITVLVDGIDPAEVEESPQVTLNIVEVDAAGDIVVNGRTNKVIVTINYLCVSDLEGTYSNPDLVPGSNGVATVTEISPGTYEVSCLPFIGYGGTDCITWTFQDVCGQLTINGGELSDSGYGFAGSGEVYPDGSFDMQFEISGGFNYTSAVSTFTPVN